MTFKLPILVLTTFVLSYVEANVDEQTCIYLCSSCNGVASYMNDRCECNIAENTKNEDTECVTRMKRKAKEHGLDIVSCDLTNDQRTTRCTLGSKRNFRKNDIDQVAKYFMKDGPITGSIFRAPPYTLKAKSSDCVAAKNDCVLEQSQKNPAAVKADTSNCNAESAKATEPEQRSTTSQLLSSNSPAQRVPVNHIIPSNTENVVGAPRIITQPEETMFEENPKQQEQVLSRASNSDCNNNNAAMQNSNGPTVAAPAPAPAPLARLFGVQSLTPTLLHILTRHLSQPLLGIPQAIQTVSQTPGISDLVSAPRHLINSLVNRLNNDAKQTRDHEDESYESKISKFQDITSTMETGIPIGNEPSPVVASQSPVANAPSAANYIVGSVPAQLSYIHPIPAYSTISMLPSPIVGSFPSLDNFVSHSLPTTYIVRSPFEIPYLFNYNTGAPPMVMYNSNANIKDSFGTNVEQTVEQQNAHKSDFPETPILKSQKKICKKSYKDEFPKKVTRNIKENTEFKNEKIIEIKRAMQEKSDIGEKEVQRTETDTIEINSSTTQKPRVKRAEDIMEKIEKFKSEIETIKRQREKKALKKNIE